MASLCGQFNSQPHGWSVKLSESSHLDSVLSLSEHSLTQSLLWDLTVRVPCGVEPSVMFPFTVYSFIRKHQ